MSCTVDTVFNFKGIKCVKLESRKYFAVVSPEIGSSVLRFFDKENGIEIFRYREDCTIADINKAREIWGLPTLYLPNRFDGGIIRTSDAIYKLPINEKKARQFSSRLGAQKNSQG